VLNPLVGELKGDDVPARVRMRCYRALHDQAARTRRQGRGAVAERGYDLTEVFELVGLDIKMLYGGPKEAVMHGIYRQNLGFTDIVIGRKHADAPYDDGKADLGRLRRQEIFRTSTGDLRIRPCNIGFAAYYDSASVSISWSAIPDEKPVVISGSRIRDCSPAASGPTSASCGRRIADILIEYYRQKK
jgi:sulfate adenylyltransferase